MGDNHSFDGDRHIQVQRYGTEELADILKARADKDLAKDLITRDQLRTITSHVAEEISASEPHERYDNATEQLYAGYPQTPIGKRSRRDKLAKHREYELIEHEGPPQSRVHRVLDSELESVIDIAETPLT